MSARKAIGCMRRTFFVVLAPLLLLSTARGQPTAERLSFEVTSVKPSKSGGILSGGLSPGGRYTASNTTLRLLLEQAYRIQPYQHHGGPAWLDSDTFDVIAEAGRPITNDEVRQMLRALLADRFKLVMHEDSAKLSGLALVTGKRGPKVQQAKTGSDIKYFVRTFGGQITGPASMSQLAEMLGNILQAPVIDKTGLPGYFDFSFPWTPARRTPVQNENPADIDQSSSLFSSLEDLGLKLESQKGLAPSFTIDHAERPSEN